MPETAVCAAAGSTRPARPILGSTSAGRDQAAGASSVRTRINTETGQRRILYLMHVDWRWIKQRPQFLAEELAAEHKVLVLHRLRIGWAPQLTASERTVPLAPLLPFPWGWKGLRWATGPLQRGWVGLAARRFRPDTLWLTHPSLVEALSAGLMRLPIVYDCMDDALAFPASKSRRELLARLERTLVERSSIILCSSGRLGELLVERYGGAIAPRISLVRNGLSTPMLEAVSGAGESSAAAGSGKALRVAYLGTVAEWFDFEALLASLEKSANVEFHLVGPVAVRNTPEHVRLKYHGPVGHGHLGELGAGFDAYVMPFRLSPLVESVDPVKLYEYVALGREVVSVRYPEVERFADFVHFYRSRSEFVQLIDDLANGRLARKNFPGLARPFLALNTWRCRSSQIGSLLSELGAEVTG
jgi:teichuronic acid biosynthesis glycosyltransferase TuaH